MGAAKGYCEDLEEGKFSFPVIHAIRNDPSGAEVIMDILRRRPEDDASKARAVQYMTEVTQSLEYTKETVSRLVARMELLLRDLGSRNAAFEAILAKIVT